MDITLSDSNVEVRNHIPDDIVFSILSKLSLRSLKRFQCVCKPWSLLFDNSYFMTMYRNYFISKDHSFYDDVSLFLHLVDDLNDEDALYSLSGERFEKIVKLDWPNNYSFDILGPISFNGTLCLGHYDNSHKIMSWNSTTTEFKIIYDSSNSCFPDFSYNHCQVGYDHVKDDYKMIRLIHCTPARNGGISSFWEIFSLNNNSWRKICDKYPYSPYRCCNEVYMDGVSHWWESRLKHIYLVSFDFSKESFITTPVPSCLEDVNNRISPKTLTVLNGSIAFIVDYEEKNTFDILILGELGVKESWIKLFTIGPLPCLKTPIGIGKKGDILIRKKDNKLAWFDISTGTIVETGVTTDDRVMIYYDKKTLLPNGGIYSKLSSCFEAL
ncbi:putative F-box protein At3g16210 [Vicia villosa]|uniref:putative F-box protein At3g16210 n=1 Tax=Vicia villosa TaxID=3911 RepID=UPI00273AB644|nr:putative F-box protein At3g16210 [Vicia villosa]